MSLDALARLAETDVALESRGLRLEASITGLAEAIADPLAHGAAGELKVSFGQLGYHLAHEAQDDGSRWVEAQQVKQNRASQLGRAAAAIAPLIRRSLDRRTRARL